MLNKGGYTIGLIDRWAIGILIYRMLVGTPPFTVKDDIPQYAKGRAYINKICNRSLEVTFPADREFSDEVKSLVSRLLAKNHFMRPVSCEEILNDDFFIRTKVPRFLRARTVFENEA